MIVPKYFEDLTILHENTMPDRAYYIPSSRKQYDLVECREHSDRFTLLNGDWQFCYYNSIYDLKEAFMKRIFIIRMFSDRSLCPPCGRCTGTTTTSTPTLITRSR